MSLHSGDRALSLSRLYLTHELPVPPQFVLYPAGWHLSFFESVERIKRKLESYSHLNFVSQFVEGSGIAEVQPGSIGISTDGADISVDLLAQRIAAGRQIDSRLSKVRAVNMF